MELGVAVDIFIFGERMALMEGILLWCVMFNHFMFISGSIEATILPLPDEILGGDQVLQSNPRGARFLHLSQRSSFYGVTPGGRVFST